MFKLFFSAFLLLSTLLASPKTFARQFIGEVLFVKGEVYATSSKIAVGSKVFTGQRIKTAAKSLVKIKMIDETIFSLGPNSEFVTDKFKIVSKNNRTTFYRLIRGKLRGAVKNKIEKGEMKVETRTTSMGVRGTEFLINSVKDSSGVDRTQIALISGEVSVLNKLNKKLLKVFPGTQFVSTISSDFKSAVMGVQKIDPFQYSRLRQNAILNPLDSNGDIAVAGAQDMDGTPLDDKHFLDASKDEKKDSFKPLDRSEWQRLILLKNSWK